jgi:hypothetical protein
MSPFDNIPEVQNGTYGGEFSILYSLKIPAALHISELANSPW